MKILHLASGQETRPTGVEIFALLKTAAVLAPSGLDSVVTEVRRRPTFVALEISGSSQ
jgi:hypothetical protein